MWAHRLPICSGRSLQAPPSSALPRAGHQTQGPALKRRTDTNNDMRERGCPSRPTFGGGVICCFICTTSFNPLENPVELEAATVILQSKEQNCEGACWWPSRGRGAEPGHELRTLPPRLGRTQTRMSPWVTHWMLTSRWHLELWEHVGGAGAGKEGVEGSWLGKIWTGNSREQGLKGTKGSTGGGGKRQVGHRSQPGPSPGVGTRQPSPGLPLCRLHPPRRCGLQSQGSQPLASARAIPAGMLLPSKFSGGQGRI